jgi:MFS family permease
MSRAFRNSLLATSRLLRRWSDRLAEIGSREDPLMAGLGDRLAASRLLARLRDGWAAGRRLLRQWRDYLAGSGSRWARLTAGRGDDRPKDEAGIWNTLRESSAPVRATLVGVFINRLGGFLQPFLVLFLTHRGFTAIQAAIALGGFGAGCFAGVLIGGAFSDRLGPRIATFASMVGYAVLLIGVLYMSNFPLLLATVFLVGLVGRFYAPTAAALLSERTPPHQQVMIFAVYRLALNLGTTAAPLLASALIVVSYSLLFWCDALTAVLYAVIAFNTLPSRSLSDRPANDREARRQSGYRAVIADRRYVFFLLALLVNIMVYMQYVSTLPLAMADAGLATIWYSFAITLNGLIVICCELVLTKYTQRLPLAVVLTVGFGLLGVGQLVYALPWGAGVFIVGTLIWTIAEITAGPTMSSYPGMAAPSELRGRYIASSQTMFNLGAAAAPVVGIAIYEAVGAQVWWWSAFGCVIGLALALTGMRRPVVVPAPAVAA